MGICIEKAFMMKGAPKHSPFICDANEWHHIQRKSRTSGEPCGRAVAGAPQQSHTRRLEPGALSPSLPGSSSQASGKPRASFRMSVRHLSVSFPTRAHTCLCIPNLFLRLGECGGLYYKFWLGSNLNQIVFSWEFVESYLNLDNHVIRSNVIGIIGGCNPPWGW